MTTVYKYVVILGLFLGGGIYLANAFGGESLTATKTKKKVSVSVPTTKTKKSPSISADTLKQLNADLGSLSSSAPPPVRVKQSSGSVSSSSKSGKAIFIYDTKVVVQGKTLFGRMMDKEDNGDIYLERYPGVYVKIPSTRIESMESVGMEHPLNASARKALQTTR